MRSGPAIIRLIRCFVSYATNTDCTLYGGDFGEIIHDGKFCVDGLVELDRSKVHSSLLEVSEAYSPADVVYEGGKFFVKNRQNFKSLDGFECVCRIKRNGEVVSSVSVDIKGVAAGAEKQLFISGLSEPDGYTTVDFTFTDNLYGICNTKQIILSDDYPVSDFKVAKIVSDNNKINLQGCVITLTEQGLIGQIEKDGETYLNEPMRFNIFRAPIDKVYMFYGGAYNCSPQQIGLAVSNDGIHFDKTSNQPFLCCGNKGDWNESESGHPYVFIDDKNMYLFYQGSPDCGKSWYISKLEFEMVNDFPKGVN